MAAKPKRPHDANQLAKLIVGISTGELEEESPDEGKNPNKVESGRKGGKVGGSKRAKSMTAEERSAAAKKAAQARWRT